MSNLDTSPQIQKCELSIIVIYFNSEIYELYEMLYSFKLRYMSNLDTLSQIQKCELSIIFIYFNSEIYELYKCYILLN